MLYRTAIMKKLYLALSSVKTSDLLVDVDSNKSVYNLTNVKTAFGVFDKDRILDGINDGCRSEGSYSNQVRIALLEIFRPHGLETTLNQGDLKFLDALDNAVVNAIQDTLDSLRSELLEDHPLNLFYQICEQMVPVEKMFNVKFLVIDNLSTDGQQPNITNSEEEMLKHEQQQFRSRQKAYLAEN